MGKKGEKRGGGRGKAINLWNKETNERKELVLNFCLFKIIFQQGGNYGRGRGRSNSQGGEGEERRVFSVRILVILTVLLPCKGRGERGKGKRKETL